jgi:hypothetical protein
MAQIPKTSVDIVFGAMTLGKEGIDILIEISLISRLISDQVPNKLASTVLKTVLPFSMSSRNTATQKLTQQSSTVAAAQSNILGSFIGKTVASSWTPNSPLAPI